MSEWWPTFTDVAARLAQREYHRYEMDWCMAHTERLLGVPYGPALCEVRPNPNLRGIEP